MAAQRTSKAEAGGADSADATHGFRVSKWLTTGSVVGLGAGLLGGVAAHETQSSFLLQVAAWAAPLGELWTNALLMLVIPLMAGTLFCALVDQDHGRGGGRRTAMSFAVFIAFLIGAGVYAVVVGLPLARMFTVDPATVAALRESVSASSRELAASAGTRLRFTDWLAGLIPTNPIGAAANGDLLALVVAVTLFSLAATRIGPETRTTLVRVARGIAETSFVLMGWVLKPMPIAAFCVAYAMAATVGISLAGALGYNLVMLIVVLALFMVLLYPVAMTAGYSLRRFAHGVAPAQAVAVATRSSLASLPALLEGAHSRMHMREEVSDLVLPLAAATFRINTMISSPFQLFFLTYLFGLPLTPEYVVVFVAASLLLSFGTPGIPGSGSSMMLPFYLAAGIPVEGVVLVAAIDAVPDIVKTLLNVTAAMTSATVVDRLDSRRAHAPVPGVAATAMAEPPMADATDPAAGP